MIPEGFVRALYSEEGIVCGVRGNVIRHFGYAERHFIARGVTFGSVVLSSAERRYRIDVREQTYAVFFTEFERPFYRSRIFVFGIHYHIHAGVGDKSEILIAYHLRNFKSVDSSARIINSVKAADRHNVFASQKVEVKRVIFGRYAFFGNVVITVGKFFNVVCRLICAARGTNRKRASHHNGKGFLIHGLFSFSQKR